MFRNNSFSTRSSSIFHQPILDKHHKEPRAKSQYAAINKINNNSVNMFLPVAKMVDMLSVKVKKLNYFLFCRLEANLKKNKLKNLLS